MLVNGVWTRSWDPVQSKDAKGRFVRQTSSFRNWVTSDGQPGPTGTGGFRAEPGRYHLYVALICPWASRTLMARKLKKLDDVISVTVVEPFLGDQGWAFGTYPGAGLDPNAGARFVHELYTAADPEYTGRATVPVLWDKKRKTIVNNESADIVRILNTAFDDVADRSIDLYPEALRGEIDAFNSAIYDTLNNGVYKAGFATTQAAYNEAVEGVFEALDWIEQRFADGRSFVHGHALTESDLRLFVTLVRFDAAYHGLFKCNIRSLAEYQNLSRYVHRVTAVPGISETVNIDHIKAGYYSIKALNPSGIVPAGPSLKLAA
ncbi:MAG: glutathione S-transferase family protein [Hyphomicrobiaceae bacterium]